MPFTRRRLIARAARVSGAVVAASALPAPARALAQAEEPGPALELPAPPLDEAGYWAVADEVVKRLDRTWEDYAGAYSSGGGGLDAIYNGALLTIHAVAAERGYAGPARNDDRARALAARLGASPPYFEGATLPHPDTMFQRRDGSATCTRSTARWTRRSTRRSPRAWPPPDARDRCSGSPPSSPARSRGASTTSRTGRSSASRTYG